jgi:hypothetical protein
MKDKIEIIIRHTSEGQKQQFYAFNEYEPDEAQRRFLAIGSEANKLHERLNQDAEPEHYHQMIEQPKQSPAPELLEALKKLLKECEYMMENGDMMDNRVEVSLARAAIAKAEGRGE